MADVPETSSTGIGPMIRRRDLRSYIASTCFHGVVLASLCAVRLGLAARAPEVTVEAVDSPDAVEERTLVESTGSFVTETPVLQSNDQVSHAFAEASVSGLRSGVAGSGVGGTASGGLGGRGARIEAIPKLGAGRGPGLSSMTFAPRLDEEIADDLGERFVKGEVAASATNYQQALSRIAQELIRLMREGPVLAVWLFDESESMRDDQAAIRADFHKVYEDIGLEISNGRSDKTKAKSKSKQPEPLLSAVVGFGMHVHPVISSPTSDLRLLRGAIDKLAVDETGRENTATAIGYSLSEYRGQAKRQKRRLVFIVVTDESGDDWEHLEDLVARVRDSRSPVYVLGREAIFGYPLAHMRWVDPIYGLTHWLPINRGPETAQAECLQWDGLHERWDAFSSGAGPYELARMASESGGIFFVLPDEEQNLSGAGASDKRRLELLDLKQYTPDIGTRQEYEESRNASRLRSTIWNVIRTLNPHLDPQLRIRELYYPVEPVKFQEEARNEFQKALRAMVLLNQAVKLLDDVSRYRAEESSLRWRANYDLLCAQCLAYRVRLFQFLLALDQHSKTLTLPRTPPNNCWNVVRRPEMLPPDPEQVQLTKVDLAELKAQEKRARELFKRVMTEHSGTPWSRRAEHELHTGFGMIFTEAFHDPRYQEVGTTIKPPNF